MTSSILSTKVKALDTLPDISSPDVYPPASNDDLVPNSSGRASSNGKRKVRLSIPSKAYKIGTLNCRSLASKASRTELNYLVTKYDNKVLCIQEHRYVHKPTDPKIVSHALGNSTLFTSSASRNAQGASIHGVGIVIHSSILPSLTSIDSIDKNIMIAVFKGNPKTYVLSCYSPHNSRPEEEVVDFYDKLDLITQNIPRHCMLLVLGDFNARLEGKFSYHEDFNRNGKYLNDYALQNNLIVSNINFQKPRNKLWTWRSPRGDLAQIDFCLCRKRWRNSIHNSQAYSTSNPVGSDHRIVSTTIKLSLRKPKTNPSKRLNWQALRNDETLGSRIGSSILNKFNSLPNNSQNYTEFLKVADQEGLKLLPERTKRTSSSDNDYIINLRKESVSAPVPDIQTKQRDLHSALVHLDEKNINETLKLFESKSSSDSRNAWNLVKELSGKKSSSQNFIAGEDRLNIWKNHFKKLLNNKPDVLGDDDEIVKLFDEHDDIRKGDFDMEELSKALSQMKNGKAPGTDSLPVEFWKIEELRQPLLDFCNATYKDNRPNEWGILKLVPVPKKGDLTKPDNYRGISLAQTASKIFNRLILNRIRPAIDKVLRPNQNGFRENRSTSSHLLALRRLIEELQNHNQEAFLIFIDFKKAFDSIIRDKMFSILEAYGIPKETVNAIRTMYRDTSCIVSTSDGDSDPFNIVTGVLQGDPLAPFLFIICLDYAMRCSIVGSDGIVLKRRRSRRHPLQILSDL